MNILKEIDELICQVKALGKVPKYIFLGKNEYKEFNDLISSWTIEVKRNSNGDFICRYKDVSILEVTISSFIEILW